MTDEETLNAGIRIASLGTAPEALGLSAVPAINTTVSAGLVLVARDLAFVNDPTRGGRLEAFEYYVAALPVEGQVQLVGLTPEVLLTSAFPRFATLQSQCGTVAIPGEKLSCATPQCLPGEVAQFSSPDFGTSRWASGTPRVTLRTADVNLTGELLAYACKEFPVAPTSNFFDTALEGTPLGPNVVMIPRSAWDEALKGVDKTKLSAPIELVATAARVASLANDLWSTGAFSEPLGDSHTFASSDILIVVDSEFLTGERRVLASKFFVSAVGLSGSSPWVGRNVSLALQPDAFGGGGRCCGPAMTGQQLEPSFGSDGAPRGCTPGPKLLCADTEFTARQAVNQGTLRNQHGKPGIELKMFGTTGQQYVFSLMPPLGGVGSNRCEFTTSDCTKDLPSGGDPFPTWEADIPRGNPACAPQVGVSGREVPASCTAASGSSWGMEGGSVTVVRPAGGGLSAAECDGRCPECSSTTSVTNTGFVPRQCYLSRSSDQDICGTNTQLAIASLQQDVLDHLGAGAPCGDLTDPAATCGDCQPYSGSLASFGGAICARCSGAGTCTYYPTAYISPQPVPVPENAIGVSSAPPSAAEDVSLAPQLPCTVGCNREGASTRLPSMAPRPGSSAQTRDGPLDNVNAGAGAPAAAHGDTVPDGPEKTTAKEPEHDGDPVNLFDGALTLDQPDLSFPGPHRPLTFSRHYNSRTNTRGSLGSNWVHSFEVRLVPLRQQNMPAWVDPYCAGTPFVTTCVMIISGDSNRLFYLDQVTGIFMPQAGSMASVRRTNVGWALREPDGQLYLFNSHGSLTRDEDRFHSGFTLAYEPTRAGELFEALCPPIPYVLDNGEYSPVAGPSLLSAEQGGCILLSGLTGLSDMPQFSPTSEVGELLFPLPASVALPVTLDLLRTARTAVINSQRGQGSTTPRFGTPQPYGARHELLTSVTDDLGRTLIFTYWDSGTRNGLLRSVTGPVGAAISFDYAAPAAQPEGLNEMYLMEAKRTDGVTGTVNVEPTGLRGYEYEYAWQRAPEQMPTVERFGDVARTFGEYFGSIYNCGFITKDACGKSYKSGVMFADNAKLISEQTRRIYSSAADNITTVRATALGQARVESETRYSRDPWDENFDRALAQRWGHEADPALPAPIQTPLSPPGVTWQTSLPLASFEYRGARPLTSGANSALIGDATDDFLPTELRARYALEAPQGTALQSSYDKGLLLLPNAIHGLPPDAVPPPLAVGELQVDADGKSRPACGIQLLPQLRSALPGYQPSLDYFDTVLPTADLATPGVSWSQALQRSAVSCETLALAETYDVRHNDLASTWTKATGGDYVYETMTGRRAHTSANANRICAWVHYVDRDGDGHYTGLNFQGRPLVVAVNVVEGSVAHWRVAETLYNADGNVLSQRRTTAGADPWQPGNGDTRYTYLEETIPARSVGSPRPFHWMKRGNVIHVLNRPRGGVVTDEVEGSTATEQSAGRYATYAYEPFFNQVRRVEAGSVTASGTEQPTARTSILFDYQELSESSAEFQRLALEAQSWGAQIKVVPCTPGGTVPCPNPPPFDPSVTIASQLGIATLNADINGDGAPGNCCRASCLRDPGADPIQLIAG